MSSEAEVGTRLPGERWAEIEHLLDLALEHPPEDRPGLVERVCAGDEVLRDHVERAGLLAGEVQAPAT